MGAAVLAAKAGLKAGAGLITAHVPDSGNVIMQTAVPSAMTSIDEDEKVFSKLPDFANYQQLLLDRESVTIKKLKML